jgi:hypothetical protein
MFIFEMVLWLVFCAAIPVFFLSAGFAAPAVIGLSSFFVLGVVVRLYFHWSR